MKNLKRSLLSFLLSIQVLFITLVSLLVPVYASDDTTYPFDVPEGYYVYKNIKNSNGTITYYLLSDEYKAQEYKFVEYGEDNSTLSMSPQMTYALYGVGDSDLSSDVLEDTISTALSDNYVAEDVISGLSEDKLAVDMATGIVKDVLVSQIDKSASFSNCFAYSGLPDEDSYVVSAINNQGLSGFNSYVNYWVCNTAGLGDWYIGCNNVLGWTNVYNQEFFNNYNKDIATFCLYNAERSDKGWNVTSQMHTSRWYQDNVAISDYHVICFQSTAASLLASSLAIFDVWSADYGNGDILSVLNGIAGGDWSELLGYADYEKIHGKEEEPINVNSYKSPLKSISLDSNKLNVDFNAKESGHLGYYVDYLTCDQYGRSYQLYRHYFFPTDDIYTNGIHTSCNALEVSFPFSNCDLSGSSDRCLLLGIGFYNYWTEDGKIAKYAPTRTSGMGDISFISAYDYYTFKYPFAHKDTSKWGWDWSTDFTDVPTKTITVDPDTNTVYDPVDTTVPFNFPADLSHDYTDYGTYVDVNDGTNGYNITYNINNTYITNMNETINNSNLSDDDKTTITKVNEDYKDKEDDSSDDSSDSSDDGGWYFDRWAGWIKSMRKFIGEVPSMLSFLWDWMPEELQTFAIASLACGFGVAVVKVLLSKE